ncbi:hypothetical protein [Microbacterium sp. NPDC056234]|uniref:hypothetical protein n=1 Tax=Microbacterium sp. NPDC056234 TaxID=3345757 RepID=UPI0035D93922
MAGTAARGYDPPMKPDDLWLAQDGNFTQVRRRSLVSRLASYAGGVIGLLAGPAMMITLGAVGAFELPSLIGGVAIIIVVGGLGLATIVSTSRMQRRVHRLEERGRLATAEVLDPRSVSLGEETGVEVTLRISGPGVPVFETTHRGTDGDIERLGSSFRVIVDPSDGAYMIVR